MASAPILWSELAARTGTMRRSLMACLQAVDDVFDRQGAFSEELFEEGVVTFGDHFHQGLVGFLGGVGEVGGDVALFALAVAIGGVGVGLHADEVDDTFEIAFVADGDLDGHGGAAEEFLDALEGALEIGSARDRAY